MSVFRFVVAAALLTILPATVSDAQNGPPGQPRAQAPPPPPSVPAVTRAEADDVLRRLADAYRREDVAAVESLHAPEMYFAFKAARDAQRLFTERNAFVLSTRTDAEELLPDGSLVLDTVVEMAARPLREAQVRREKRRWRMQFARRAERGVVIAGQLPAEAGLLPSDPPWRNANLRADVLLPAGGAPRATVRVDVTLALHNTSSTPQDEVAFALHPFSSGVTAHQGESLLAATRTEASLDAWRIRLTAPVAPGADAELRLRYELEQPGAVAAAAIDRDLVRLYGVSAWLPIVEPARGVVVPERSHDVRIVAPDGIVASMPGRRTEEPSPGAGLHATRFVSELPGADTPLVAVRGTRQEVRLGAGLVLDVLRAENGGDGTVASTYVTTLAAFLEDRLGPSPVSRIALAESIDGGFREAPGWMALPSLTVPKEDADVAESDQVFFFVGLGMTRLWVLHARAPTGVGARHVALGLCEHLIGAWARAAVDEDIAQVQREETLSYTQLDPQLDRPLLPAQEDRGTPPLFKEGKARIVFDMHELLVGAPAWRDTLLSWSQGTARGARIETLLDRMGGTAVKDAFLDAFFRRQGASQVSIAGVELVPLPPEEAARLQLDPQAWKRVEITIDNAGLGPVPVEVQVQVDQAVRHERVIAPSYGRVVLQLVAGNLPSRIKLDPQRILWQSRGDDDNWPAFKHEKRDEFDGAVSAGGRGDASSAGQGRDQLRGE